MESRVDSDHFFVFDHHSKIILIINNYQKYCCCIQSKSYQIEILSTNINFEIIINNYNISKLMFVDKLSI